jgi:hypothetical protein
MSAFSVLLFSQKRTILNHFMVRLFTLLSAFLLHCPPFYFICQPFAQLMSKNFCVFLFREYFLSVLEFLALQPLNVIFFLFFFCFGLAWFSLGRSRTEAKFCVKVFTLLLNKKVLPFLTSG